MVTAPDQTGFDVAEELSFCPYTTSRDHSSPSRRIAGKKMG